MKAILLLLLILVSFQVKATPPTNSPLFTYEGVLMDSGGIPITTPQAVTFQVLYSSCVAYEETQSISPGSQGEFSVVIGSGIRTDSTGNTAEQIFASSGSMKCQGGSPVTVSGFSNRSLHIRIGDTDLSPDVTIYNVPFSFNSQKLADKGPSDFVQTSTSVTQVNVESIFSRFSQLDAILSKFNTDGTSLGANISGNAATATTVTGTVAIANGGTGATEAGAARTNLGLGALATMSPTGTADATTYLRGDGTWAPAGGSQAATQLGGDLSGTLPNPIVEKIKGQSISSTATAAGQVLRYSGANTWTPGFVAMTDLKSSVTGSNSFANSCGENQTLTYNSVGDMMSCVNISISDANVSGTAAIAWSKISKAGALPSDIGAASVDHNHPPDISRAPAAGSTDITTLGTITTGTWNGTTIAVQNGGTGVNSVNGNMVFAGPAGGGNGAPSFRALTLADLPALPNSWNSTGGGIDYSGGNVGIGAPNPTATLDVHGAIKSRDVLNNSSTIDFATGNLQYTSANCGVFALHNLKPGGTYTFAVQGSAGGTCSFIAYPGSGTGTLILKAGTTNLTQNPNKHILFSFLVMGNFVYVASIDY